MNGSSPTFSGAGTPEKATRLSAALIDGVIAVLLTGLLGGIPVLGGIVGAAYLVVRDGLEIGPVRDRSVGKHLMGLRLVRLDGKPLVWRPPSFETGCLGLVLLRASSQRCRSSVGSSLLWPRLRAWCSSSTKYIMSLRTHRGVVGGIGSEILG